MRESSHNKILIIHSDHRVVLVALVLLLMVVVMVTIRLLYPGLFVFFFLNWQVQQNEPNKGVGFVHGF